MARRRNTGQFNRQSSFPNKGGGSRGRDSGKSYPGLSKAAQALVRYWKFSVEEGEQLKVAGSDVSRFGVDLPLDDYRTGRTTGAVLRTLRDRIDEANRKSKREQDRERQSEQVLICPAAFSKRRRGDSGPPFLEAIWFPADLDANGLLRPSRDIVPWIPRNLLEPMVSDNDVAIGTTADVEEFSTNNLPAQWSGWEQFVAYGEGLLKAVTGSAVRTLAIDGYERRPHAVIVPFNSSLRSLESLLGLYEDALSGKRDPGLLPQFTNPKTPERKEYSKSPSALRRAAIKHTGHFGDNFPLAESQRLALHRMLETGADDFLCVTGPPGTGKTTLLQSVIASMWVNAVGSAQGMPPVVVACGATNQSVMNIIDSFAKLSSGAGLLAERWLPEFASYGTFCSSATRAEDLSGYHLELMDGSGASSRMEQPEYIQAAERHFLKNYARCFNKQRSLKQATRDLAGMVQEERGAIYRAVQTLCGGTLGELLRVFFGGKPRSSYWNSMRSLAELDTTRRHRAFLYATHYWEARWLAQASMDVAARRSTGYKEKYGARRSDWQRRAMLTPVFVSTLAMAPRFFASRQQETDPPADFLIFDEAGQIPIEIGAALLTLATRALIVGDLLQLEPVWNIAPHIDQRNAETFGLLPKKEAHTALKQLRSRGSLASSGSLMRLSLSSSKRTEGSKLGAFLSEHRRSVPQIVGFCNQLAYRGRLESVRGDMERRILPAFGYIHVSGGCERRGTSWLNRRDAKQIALWIDQNKPALEAFYGLPIEEIVAVISPFAAQVHHLKMTLAKRFPQMTIGTVNALQGAERPIVLFSPVYDRRHKGPKFFDRSVHMLNVAVSRAKDSFIVLGDMDLFNPEGQAPSSVLARFLFADPSNELTPAEPIGLEEFSAQETRFLLTLDQHREVLNGALADAKREVVIVSAFVGIAAIKHDRLDDLIRAAVERGVRVGIYVSPETKNGKGPSESVLKGREALITAGAELKIADRIHDKMLLIDDHTLVIGSFNWLSAVRDGRYGVQNSETSTLYTGPKVVETWKVKVEDLELRTRLHGDLIAEATGEADSKDELDF